MSFRIRSVKSRNSTRGQNGSQIDLGLGDQPLARNNKLFPKNNQCSADMPMIGGERPPRDLRPKVVCSKEQWARSLDRRASELDQRMSQLDQRTSQAEQSASQLEQRASPLDKRASQPDQRMSQAEQSASQLEQRASPLDKRASQLDQRVSPVYQKDSITDKRAELRTAAISHCNSTEFDTAFNEKHIDDVPRPSRHRMRGLGRAFMIKDNECSWMRNMQAQHAGRVNSPVRTVPRGAASRQERTASPQQPASHEPREANSDWYMAQMQNIQRQQQLLYQQQQTLLHKIATVCPSPAISCTGNCDPNTVPGFASNFNATNAQDPAAMLQMVNHAPAQAFLNIPSPEGETLAERSKAAKDVYMNLLRQQHDELKQQQQLHHQEPEQRDQESDEQLQDYYEEEHQQISTKYPEPENPMNKTPFKRRLKGRAAARYAARDEGTADLVMFRRGADDLPPDDMEISAKEQDARNSRAASAASSVMSNARSCVSRDNTITPSNGLRESLSLYGQNPSEKRAVGPATGSKNPHWQGSRCNTAPIPRSPEESVTSATPNTSANNTEALLSHVRRRLEEQGEVAPDKAPSSRCRPTPRAVELKPVESAEVGTEKEWWEGRTPPKELIPLD